MIRLTIATSMLVVLLAAGNTAATYLPTIRGFSTSAPISTSEAGQHATSTSTSESAGTPGSPFGTATSTPSATEETASNQTSTPTVTSTSTGSNGAASTPTPTLTPTLTPTPLPSPYNVQAQSIVLQLDEVGDSFRLESSTPLTLSEQVLAWGGVQAYRTRFLNDAAQPSGPNSLESAAVVFRTVGGASNAFASEIAYTEKAENYTRITVPTYGNASAAFQETGAVNGQSIDTFYVFAYKGNIWAGILIKGPADVTELEDAEPYLQAMLAKLH